MEQIAGAVAGSTRSDWCSWLGPGLDIRRYGGVYALLVAEAAPEDAEDGDDGNGDEGSDDSADLAPGEDAEDLDERGDLQRLAHDAGGVDVVLDETPGSEEEEERKQVRVAGEEGYAEDGYGGYGGSDDGDELEDACEGAEDEGVGDARDAEEEGVGGGGESGEDDLGADVAAEHDVDVGDDAAIGLPFLLVPAEVDDTVCDGAAVEEEEEAEDGDEDEPPDVGERLGELGGDSAGVAGEIVFVGDEEALDLLLVGGGPAMFGAEVCDELAGGEAAEEGWKTLHEGARFIGDLGSDEQAEAGEDGDEDEVGEGDGSSAAAEGCFEAGDQGLDQICEEDGEEKEGEGVLGVAQEDEDDGED